MTTDKTTLERQELQAALNGPKGYSCMTQKKEQQKK